jgi:hypothetical protein
MRILIIVLIAVAVIFCAWWMQAWAIVPQHHGDPSRLEESVTMNNKAVPSPSEPPHPPSIHQSVSAPAELTGFPQWSQDRQGDLVDRLQADPNWPQPFYQYLSDQLGNRTLDPMIRNGIANGLMIQGKPDPMLHRRLIAMINDQEESPTWREYAVQHLAGTMRFSGEPDLVLTTLKRVFREGIGSMPGTAFIQLHRLAEAGLADWDKECQALALAKLQDQKTDALTRISIVSVCAERNAEEALPIIRNWATSDQPAFRRVAMAALGQLGGKTDKAILISGLEDPDEMVADAARSARVRLDKRMESAKP